MNKLFLGEMGPAIKEQWMEDSDVLVVDDDQLILDLTSSFFQSEGMEVHCVLNGEEALRMLRERTFTLMVTDLNMPGMDGIELAVKAREIAPRMPIFMSTGDISPEVVRLAAEAGIAKVFSKPFHLTKVLALIRKTR